MTPVGSLAGIIWFHIIGLETREQEIELPTRPDICLYGAVHFLETAGLTALAIPAANAGLRWATGK